MIHSSSFAACSGARIGRPTRGTISGRRSSLPSALSKRPESSLLSTEPSSTRGREHTYWPDGEPTIDVLNGAPGVVLAPATLRKLGRSALAVWETLLQIRGYGCHQFRAKVAELSFHTDLPMRTVKWCLARLEEVGLLEREVVTVSPKGWRMTPGRKLKVRPTGVWSRELSVRVWGAVSWIRKGPLYWVPPAAEYTISALPGHGGSRLGTRQKNWSDHFQDCPTPPKNTQKCESSATTLQALTEQDCPSITYKYKGLYNVLPSTKEVAPPAGRSQSFGCVPEEAPPPLRIEKLDPAPRQRTVRLKLKGDPDDPDPAISRQVKLEWMTQLVDAYNQAYRAVGVKTYQTLPFRKRAAEFGTYQAGTFTPAPVAAPRKPRKGKPAPASPLDDWKHLAKLMACARVLAERDIPPTVWAEWCVARAKGAVRPIGAIFSAGQADNRAIRAIFRQESGYGHGDGSAVLKPTQANYEQMFRHRESRRLADGRGGGLFGFPPWYVSIRQQEINQGFVDPMTLYPSIQKETK